MPMLIVNDTEYDLAMLKVMMPHMKKNTKKQALLFLVVTHTLNHNLLKCASETTGRFIG